MAGMPKEGTDSYAQEASDKITPTVHNQSAVERAKEKAGGMAERVKGALQPGDSKSTTRRLSDTPAETNPQAAEQQGGKGMLQQAQETVAKALGGGSRGGWAVF
ncbi:hypothetical protein VTN00DRAFT_8944 [Thermoascus crustaceus]|uniref:uncharacterized protein n=1 Tax=Thermoascus crustaceus TaxID=5088 RepID=UPI0037431D2F